MVLAALHFLITSTFFCCLSFMDLINIGVLDEIKEIRQTILSSLMVFIRLMKLRQQKKAGVTRN